MQEIYITGHRNPDLDSVSSAWCYARLKNIVDSENKYTPIRIGPLNEATKVQFKNAKIKPPTFVKDVRAKVADVVIKEFLSMHPDAPIFNLVTMFRERRASVVPLLDKGKYRGLLSLDEITSFFLKENAGKRPNYLFYPENFSKVIRGKFIKKNSLPYFDAHIMTGAMEFDVYCKRLKTLLPKLPVLVVGKKRQHIEYAIENQFPAIILTGLEEGESLDIDYSNFNGIIYQSYEDTAETIRLLRMSLPVHQLLQKEPPHVQSDDLFDDAKRTLAESEFRGLPVFKENEFVGFVTRRCFLEKPRRKVIMVDHNELDQSVEGLEEAEIIEIIDHHRLDAEKTTHPIFIAAEPVGSTCTIVYHQYLRWSVPVDKTTATMLIAGIIADTVILKSPTTTPIDVAAVKNLSKIAQIDDVRVFGEKLFAASSVLTKANPAQVISADFKNYDEKGVRFGIGQVEVTTLEEIDEVKSAYAKELAFTKQSHGLDWAMLLITDVIKEESILMTTPYPRKEKAIAYPVLESGIYLLKGVLSRKKQLLPEIIRVLEEVS